jgi:uncharacterized membrane protein
MHGKHRVLEILGGGERGVRKIEWKSPLSLLLLPLYGVIIIITIIIIIIIIIINLCAFTLLNTQRTRHRNDGQMVHADTNQYVT